MNLGVPTSRRAAGGADFPLQDFFAERIALSQQSVPSYAMPHAIETYDFNGPANGTTAGMPRTTTTSRRAPASPTRRRAACSGG
jgi:hypothetical protein